MIKLTIKSIQRYRLIEHSNIDHKCLHCHCQIYRHSAIYRYASRILCTRCYWAAINELQEGWS